MNVQAVVCGCWRLVEWDCLGGGGGEKGGISYTLIQIDLGW